MVVAVHEILTQGKESSERSTHINVCLTSMDMPTDFARLLQLQSSSRSIKESEGKGGVLYGIPGNVDRRQDVLLTTVSKASMFE
jgi:hypothetical protein